MPQAQLNFVFSSVRSSDKYEKLIPGAEISLGLDRTQGRYSRLNYDDKKALRRFLSTVPAGTDRAEVQKQLDDYIQESLQNAQTQGNNQQLANAQRWQQAAPVVQVRGANKEIQDLLSKHGLLTDQGFISHLDIDQTQGNFPVLTDQDKTNLRELLNTFQPTQSHTEAQKMLDDSISQNLQIAQVTGNQPLLVEAQRLQQAGIAIQSKTTEEMLDQARNAGVEKELSRIVVERQVSSASVDALSKTLTEELKKEFGENFVWERAPQLSEVVSQIVIEYSEKIATEFAAAHQSPTNPNATPEERFKEAQDKVKTGFISGFNKQSNPQEHALRDSQVRGTLIDPFIGLFGQVNLSQHPGLEDRLTESVLLTLHEQSVPQYYQAVDLDSVAVPLALAGRQIASKQQAVAKAYGQTSPLLTALNTHLQTTTSQGAFDSLELKLTTSGDIFGQFGQADSTFFVPVATQEQIVTQIGDKIQLDLQSVGYTEAEAASRAFKSIKYLSDNPTAILYQLSPELDQASRAFMMQKSEFQKKWEKYSQINQPDRFRRLENDLILGVIKRTVGRSWLWEVDKRVDSRTGKVKSLYVFKPWKAIYETISLKAPLRGMANFLEEVKDLNSSIERLIGNGFFEPTQTARLKLQGGARYLDLDLKRDLRISTSWKSLGKTSADFLKARKDLSNLNNFKGFLNLLRKKGKREDERDDTRWALWILNVLLRSGWGVASWGASKIISSKFIQTRIAPTPFGQAVSSLANSLKSATPLLRLVKGVPGGILAGHALNVLFTGSLTAINPGFLLYGGLAGFLGKAGLGYGAIGYFLTGGNIFLTGGSQAAFLAGAAFGKGLQEYGDFLQRGGFELAQNWSKVPGAGWGARLTRFWGNVLYRPAAWTPAIGGIRWGGLVRPVSGPTGPVNFHLFRLPFAGPGAIAFLGYMLGWGLWTWPLMFLVGVAEWGLTTYLPFRVADKLNKWGEAQAANINPKIPTFTGLQVSNLFGFNVLNYLKTLFGPAGLLTWGAWFLFFKLVLGLNVLPAALLAVASSALTVLFLGKLFAKLNPYLGKVATFLFRLTQIWEIIDIIKTQGLVGLWKSFWDTLSGPFRKGKDGLLGFGGWVGSLVKLALTIEFGVALAAGIRAAVAAFRSVIAGSGGAALWRAFLQGGLALFRTFFLSMPLVSTIISGITVLAASVTITSALIVGGIVVGVVVFLGATIAGITYLSYRSSDAAPTSTVEVRVIPRDPRTYQCYGSVAKGSAGETFNVSFNTTVANNNYNQRISFTARARPTLDGAPLPDNPAYNLAPNPILLEGRSSTGAAGGLIPGVSEVGLNELPIENVPKDRDATLVVLVEVEGLKNVDNAGQRTSASVSFSTFGSCTVYIGAPRLDNPRGYPAEGVITSSAFSYSSRSVFADAAVIDNHLGGAIDIAGNNFKPVHATHEGEATVYTTRGGGLSIKVIGRSHITSYLHLNRVNSGLRANSGRAVAVRSGCLIGWVDNSGTNTTGPHVHYEIIRRDGRPYNPTQRPSDRDEFNVLVPQYSVNTQVRPNMVNNTGDCFTTGTYTAGP